MVTLSARDKVAEEGDGCHGHAAGHVQDIPTEVDQEAVVSTLKLTPVDFLQKKLYKIDPAVVALRIFATD